MKRVIVVGIALMSLGGCGTTEVLPIGPDTYRVRGMVDAGLAEFGSGEAEALKKANAYCQSQGRQIQMLATQNASSIAVDGAAVTFRCLKPGEPDLRRLKYRPIPDVVIENR